MHVNKYNIPAEKDKSQLIKQWNWLYYTLPLDLLLIYFLDFEKRLAPFAKFLEVSLIIALIYSCLYSTRFFWFDLFDQKGRIKNFIKRQQKQISSFSFILIFGIITICTIGFLLTSDFGKTKILQIAIPLFVAISTLNTLRKAKIDLDKKNVKMRLNNSNLHLYSSRWISFSAALLYPFSQNVFIQNSLTNFFLCFLLSFVLLLAFRPE
jgi:hypothetical protein